MSRVLVLVLAVSVAACGLTRTRGPGAYHTPDGRPRCTESMTAPKSDALGAVVGLFSILLGVVAYKVADNETVGAPLIVGGVLVTGVSYASGAVGYYRVKKCRTATEEFDRRAPVPVTSS